MTPEYLARLKELCDKATPGPWDHNECIITEYDKYDIDSHRGGSPNSYECINYVLDWAEPDSKAIADAQFIAAAREAIPALIQEVERLNRILLQDLSEDDELGAEYSYVLAMKGENARLREALKKIGTGKGKDTSSTHDYLIAREPLRGKE